MQMKRINRLTELPPELLVQIFEYEGIADLCRRVNRQWRYLAYPICFRRLRLLPSDPFKPDGMLDYLQEMRSNPMDFRNSCIKSLEICARGRNQDFDGFASSGGSDQFFVDAQADEDCVENVLMIQSLLGGQIIDFGLTDMLWSVFSVEQFLDMNLTMTNHLQSFQLELYKPESHASLEIQRSLGRLFERDYEWLRSVVLDGVPNVWNLKELAKCERMEEFHLSLNNNGGVNANNNNGNGNGIHHHHNNINHHNHPNPHHHHQHQNHLITTQSVLPKILQSLLPNWPRLQTLYLCQPCPMDPTTLLNIRTLLPNPTRLLELHLYFEACQYRWYENEFIEMIRIMPNLRVLDAHIEWTNAMMATAAACLPNLKELDLSCAGFQFDCFGITKVVWGRDLTKIKMRTSARICAKFLQIVKQRSEGRVNILTWGNRKYAGVIDEWE